MPTVLGYAVVNTDGTVLHQSGVQEVVHAGTGLWHVYFNFAAATACQVASLADAGAPAGWICAYGYGEGTTGDNVVTVVQGGWQGEAGPNPGGVVPVPVFGVAADHTFQLMIVE
ncbi:MAG TPA: hypothetical protein VEL03_04240 [Streptosporangiaceae bacterium]|nr:hypothetical protein [Streptosporangiaceae bacterium]